MHSSYPHRLRRKRRPERPQACRETSVSGNKCRVCPQNRSQAHRHTCRRGIVWRKRHRHTCRRGIAWRKRHRHTCRRPNLFRLCHRHTCRWKFGHALAHLHMCKWPFLASLCHLHVCIWDFGHALAHLHMCRRRFPHSGDSQRSNRTASAVHKASKSASSISIGWPSGPNHGSRI